MYLPLWTFTETATVSTNRLISTSVMIQVILLVRTQLKWKGSGLIYKLYNCALFAVGVHSETLDAAR